MARKYEKQKRAEREQATRQRIVEAAVELHEAVGGAGATPTVIAERAGVGRVTYYRHFPDQRSLLSACTSHYLGQNPPPDPTGWTALPDPAERLRAALADLYAWYDRAGGMLARAEQEMPSNPILAELMTPFKQYLSGIRELLLQEWRNGSEPPPELPAAIGHAIAFSTWQSLVREQGLTHDQAIDLIVRLARNARG
jgi:AcrR family transcriptional regulator